MNWYKIANKFEPWKMTREQYESMEYPPLKPHEVFYIKVGDLDVEVIQNPTNSDIRQMSREEKQDHPGEFYNLSLRSTSDVNGNKYYWKAGSAIHWDIEMKLKQLVGEELNQNYGSRLPYNRMLYNALKEKRYIPKHILDNFFKTYPDIAKEFKIAQSENILNETKDDNIFNEEISTDNLKIPEKSKENIKIVELKNVQEGQPTIVKVYHGTPDGRFLPEFDPNKKGYYKNAPDLLPDNTLFNSIYGDPRKGFQQKSILGNIGVSFTDNKETAQSYANKPPFDNQNSIPMVVERYVLLKNPKVLDLAGKEWKHTVNNDIQTAINEGYDSLVLKNIKDDYHPWQTKKPTNNLIIFDINQIKINKDF